MKWNKLYALLSQRKMELGKLMDNAASIKEYFLYWHRLNEVSRVIYKLYQSEDVELDLELLEIFFNDRIFELSNFGGNNLSEEVAQAKIVEIIFLITMVKLVDKFNIKFLNGGNKE